MSSGGHVESVSSHCVSEAVVCHLVAMLIESVSSHCVSEAVVCHLVAMLNLLALTVSVRL